MAEPAEEALERLAQLGLSEYEARAYVALLLAGESAAVDLAAASKVPQPRVYGVLKKLEERGLVESVLGPPTRYRATPLDAFLRQHADDLKQRAQTLEADAQRLARELRPRAEGDEVGRIAIVRGRRNILARAYELARAARRTLQVSGTGVLSGEELARGLVTVVRDRSAAGVDVRIVLPVTDATLERTRRLARHAQVRHNDAARRTFAMIVDGKTALLGRLMSATEGTESALVSSDGAIVAFATEATEHLWATGEDLVERAAELAGKEARRMEVVRSRDAALAEARALVEGAKERLDCSLSEMGAYQLLAMRDALGAAKRRGVAIRVLAPRTRANAKALDELAKLGEARAVDATNVRFVLADGRRALLIDPPAGKDTPFLDASAFGPLTLRATHPGLGELLDSWFEAKWVASSGTA